MIVIDSIVLLITIVLLIIIVSFSYCKIFDWKIDREIKQERVKRSAIEKRLTKCAVKPLPLGMGI